MKKVVDAVVGFLFSLALFFLVVNPKSFGDATNWEAERLIEVVLRPDVDTVEVQEASVGS